MRDDLPDWFLRLETVFSRVLEGTMQVPKISSEAFEQLGQKPGTKYLRTRLPEILEMAKVPSNEHLRCFHHDDHDPSMVYNRQQLHFHCFACHREGEGWDLPDLIGFVFGENNFNNKRRIAERMFVEVGQTRKGMQPATSFAKATEAVKGVYKPYHTDPECVEFVKQRGITAESAVKWGLKWWEHPRTQDHYLVIPVQQKFVVRRRYQIIHGDPNQKKYMYPYNPDQLPDKKPKLFNAQIMDTCAEYSVIYVVESALDAIIIAQMGYRAVAINSTGNADLLQEYFPIITQKHLIIVLLFDNDEEGVESAIELAAELKAAKIMHYRHQYPKDGLVSYLSKVKDVGESYVIDPDRTEQVLALIRAMLLKKYRPAVKSIATEIRGQSGTPSATISNALAGWGFGDTWVSIGQLPNFVNKNKNDEEDGDQA